MLASRLPFSSGIHTRLAFAVAAHPRLSSRRSLEPAILLVDKMLEVIRERPAETRLHSDLRCGAGQLADHRPSLNEGEDWMDDLLLQRAAHVQALRESLERLVRVLSRLEGVERIILFGSYARGRHDLFTDLDILVVMETEQSFLERLRTLYSLLALPVDLDLLCYTPTEWASLQERPFFKRLRAEEVVLYEKKRP